MLMVLASSSPSHLEDIAVPDFPMSSNIFSFASQECLDDPCPPSDPSVFEAFFGSARLTACPVSNGSNLALDFIGFDEASHPEWIDEYEDIGFMCVSSTSKRDYIEMGADAEASEGCANTLERRSPYHCRMASGRPD
uniref:Uncharacterized protein n=1 Tax=Hanusia phi TaxID=3032 RepID=A0A7S0EGW8_9CRYP|mmetsp:Transcript_23337/g.52431  ORF Transcript_23337/g.52431 Transcript_23337/m.52431 type:complete len:137 (+) Transcript_23337:137-547(+)